MWAVLWNGWKRGKETICHADLEFGWATSPESDWHKFNIFHNAGVTSPDQGLFYKALYMDKMPYDEDIKVDDKTASKKYWEIIKNVSQKSVLK
jgi:hypothetical protein